MAEEYVNVPEVLPDSLKDEFLKDSIAAAMSSFKREMLWANINRHHEKVVAHFQANPIISDDAKGKEFLASIRSSLPLITVKNTEAGGVIHIDFAYLDMAQKAHRLLIKALKEAENG